MLPVIASLVSYTQAPGSTALRKNCTGSRDENRERPSILRLRSELGNCLCLWFMSLSLRSLRFNEAKKNNIDLHRFVIFENITQLISWLVLVADIAGALIG